ncbi:MAG: hypothetical protein OXG71_04660, partial [Rhodospirillales bacterium]|nr:hypothetical protein [Rhodospirillales bacterium]
RAVACLLAVALALSLASGTAAAQAAPALASAAVSGNTITITWTEAITGGNWQLARTDGALTVTVDGTARTFTVSALQGGAQLQITLDGSPPPDGAVVVVFFQKTSTQPLTAQGVPLESFGWNLATNMAELTVYDALKSYFSGQSTLSDTESIVGSYLDRLNEIVAEGAPRDNTKGLSGLFNVDTSQEGRTNWGTPGTEDWAYWAQSQGRPGYTCGGQDQPQLQGQDVYEFGWACTHSTDAGSTTSSQWVPVKLPQPNIDFTPDHQLIWTHAGGIGCTYWAVDPLYITSTVNENGEFVPQQGTKKWTTFYNDDRTGCAPPPGSALPDRPTGGNPCHPGTPGCNRN